MWQPVYDTLVALAGIPSVELVTSTVFNNSDITALMIRDLLMKWLLAGVVIGMMILNTDHFRRLALNPSVGKTSAVPFWHLFWALFVILLARPLLYHFVSIPQV